VEGAGYEGFELAPRVGNAVGREPDAELFTAGGQKVGNVAADSAGASVSELSECSGSPPAQEGNISFPIRKFLVRLSEPISDNQQVQLRLSLTTPPNRGILKKESWRIEVWRKGNVTQYGLCEAVMVATNDAGYVPLPVVTRLPSFPPKAPHRPPLTVVALEFILDPLDTNAAAFVLRAPKGFMFPVNCLGPRSPPIRCDQLPTNQEGQSRARLTCINGGTECMRRLSTFVLVSTPRLAPKDPKQNIWFVEAVLLNNFGDVSEQLGRAENPGWALIDMTAEISYAPMSGVPVDIAMSFRPRVNLPAGAQIYILAPKMLRRFGCGDVVVGFLNPLSLGTLRTCTETMVSPDRPDSIWSVTLVLNNTLVAGDHVITIPAETPVSSSNVAGNNIFEIYVRDQFGRNADVALQIPGEGLEVGFRMIAWPLWWSKVPYWINTCQVSVPIEVLDDADVPVSMILITLPLMPPMNHSVSSMSDVSISTGEGNSLPVTGLMIPNQNTLVFKLDDTVLLKQGLYAIRFWIELPARRSQLDIWRVAVCSPGANETSCRLDGMARSGRGSHIKAVFALPGFDGHEAPSTSLLLPMVATASLAYRAWTPPSIASILLFAMLTAFLTVDQ